MAYAQESIKPYRDNSTKREQVKRMFDNIAHSYDTLNGTLSFGIDKLWRRTLINRLKKEKNAPKRILDIATGTGDLAISACKELNPDVIIGCDISEGMMKIGEQKAKNENLEGRIEFKYEDCADLSFKDGEFDAVISAFALRNFENLDKCLEEMHRVLNSKGFTAIIDLCRPESFPMKQLFHIYEKAVMPFIGKLISHDGYAYSYLPKTMDAVPQGEDMKKIFEKAGFHNVEYKRLAFGMCMMYIGRK